MPKYPIYIPSKGRAETGQTAQFLARWHVPFSLVVEPQDYDVYAAQYPQKALIQLPENDQGISYVRNFCKDHAEKLGYKRHWQMDDNIKSIKQFNKRQAIDSGADYILATVEEFVDRYANVALAGLRHVAFIRLQTTPFSLNQQVYSCFLVLNELPYRFTNHTIEDTDYNLQVLSSGWCTILFGIEKATSGTMRGGNTDSEFAGKTLRQSRIGRARTLQRTWPCVTGIRKSNDKVVAVVNWRWTKQLSQLELCNK
jgi:hypothetical protein